MVAEILEQLDLHGIMQEELFGSAGLARKLTAPHRHILT